ncbi:hypothetical protein M2651_04680 [Clostridium sp. SYSU_GA19001]|uniref:hypothetical protein n=1 Tax=Clostridium caldaquaticum TaxID=2940653 RepID=UPI0020778870|nr:hypothetical protein [Clostridium caldaquaticum]MCM8710321.1 hypothetical protein [Clostridium caldaquaticum]
MKSFDDLDKKIDKYYEGSLDGATSDELEIKSALDKMNLIEAIEENIPINIDISNIVEAGEKIRFNNKLRKSTFKFLILAILISALIGYVYIKVSIYVIVAIQFLVLITLLILNYVLLKKKVRSEVK